MYFPFFGFFNTAIVFAMMYHRETVCCLPSFTRHLLVCLPHFGLRPVRLDKLRICLFQSRQRQQNISLTCAHKAGLFFAKIPNWDGLSRQMSEPKWTKSKLRQTFQRLSRCPTLFWSGKLRDRQRWDRRLYGNSKDGIADHVIFHMK